MYYYIANDGYINVVGNMGGDLHEIDEAKYNEIQTALANKPTSGDSDYDYRLKETLEWELYKIQNSPHEEIGETEALDILLGGAV